MMNGDGKELVRGQGNGSQSVRELARIDAKDAGTGGDGWD